MIEPADTPPPEKMAALPVALDAMGGDRAPGVVVEGALLACQKGQGPVTLVGDEAAVRAVLDRLGAGDAPIDVVHASETIGMAEHPGKAARTKRDSSMHVGFRLLQEGRACGFVSAGNSGAMMATGLLTVRRIPRCDRPAIASALPTQGSPTVLLDIDTGERILHFVLDIGANVEVRASHLVQFALMGGAYAEVLLERPRPTVGLLSNGTEPTKGTDTLREAHRLLTTTDLKYVGFVEGRQVPRGEVDVVVTDGFTGNVMLKLSEGIALALLDRLRDELRGDWVGSLGASLIRRSLRRLGERLDWASIGGAPLLGLDGVALVAHGSSTPRAIANAVALARQHAAVDLVGRLKVVLEESAPGEETTSTSELPLTRTSGSHETP